MPYYELSFLTPNLNPDQKNKLISEIEIISKKAEGKLVESFIEKKKFAYPVKKQREGFLGIISLELSSEKITEIKNELNKNESILRLLIEKKKAVPKKSTSAKGPKKTEKTEISKKPKKPKVKIEKLDEKLDELLK